MKDDNLSKIFLVIPLSCASVFLDASPTVALESSKAVRADSILIANNRHSDKVRIAQNDGGNSGVGSITPEKIRIVVYEKLRQNWRASGAADGAKAVVRFTVMKNGQLFGAPSLRASAGVPDFDQACIDAAEKVAPFPPLPPYLSDISFIGTFYAGKAPWVELALDSDQSSGGKPSQATNSGQSGWTQPSGGSSQGDSATELSATALAATGQSAWTQPAAGAPSSSQSGWTQPSGSSSANQSSWTQPSGSSSPAGQNGSVDDSGELQAQPLGLASTAQSLGKPPVKTPPPQASAKTSPPGKTQPVKNQKPASTGQSAPAKLPPGQVPHGQSQQTSAPPPVQNMQMQQQTTTQPAQTDMSGSQDLSQRVVLLNNNAVVAIADNNYEAAIKKLEEALKIDPTYQQARANLAIAYNNYGLQLKDRPDDAIKVFHKAYALDPGNEKTKVNLDTIIQYMGKSPRVFKDRLDLGNKALAQGDRLGARIEYEAALAIKPDPIIQQKLYAIINGAPLPPSNGNPGSQNPGNQAQGTGQLPLHKGIQPGSGKPGFHVAKPAAGIGIGAHKPPDQPSDGTADGAQTGVSQKLDTMYRNLKNLEVKTFGKPFESDDVLTRLSRLEQKLLGKAQQGKPMRRLDALLLQ